MNLNEYVQGLQAKGYSRDQIVTYLKKYGYTDEVINNAFVDPLDNYVLTYLRQGYQPGQLFNYLLSQGYNTIRLQKIFSSIDKQFYDGKMPLEVIHKHDISTGTIVKIGVMMLVLILIVGGGIFFVPGMFQKKLLDVEATPLDNILKQGDTLRFDVVVISQGTPGRVDMNFRYAVRNKQGLLVMRESDTRAVDTTLRFVKDINLPDVLPSGQYTVDVLAEYEGLQPTPSMFTFTVVNTGDPITSPPVIKKNITNKTTVTPTTPARTSKPVVVITPTDTTKSDQDYINDALDAKTAGEGVGNCELITDEFLQDECKILLARQYADSTVCELISTQVRKENCYMDFVLAGQTELCSHVQTNSNKQLCDQFVVMYNSTPNLPPAQPTTPPDGFTPTIDDLDVTDVLE